MNRLLELLISAYDSCFEFQDGDSLKLTESIELQKLLIANGFDTPARRERLQNLENELKDLQKDA